MLNAEKKMEQQRKKVEEERLRAAEERRREEQEFREASRRREQELLVRLSIHFIPLSLFVSLWAVLEASCMSPSLAIFLEF